MSRRVNQHKVSLHALTSILAAAVGLAFGCGGMPTGSKTDLRQFEQAYDAALVISTVTLPAATIGEGYETKLLARGQPKPFLWTMVSGQLPAGLELAHDGTISGTPSVVTTSSFVVRVKCKTEPIPDDRGGAPHVAWRMRQLTLVVKGLQLR